MGRLIGIERLEEIVATVLLTGRIQFHRPISVFMIAPHGCGKTSVLLERQCETAAVLSDLTATGMQWLMQVFPRASHFILGDLGVVMAHSPRAREFFFANLLPLAEEGLHIVAGPKGMIDFKGQQRGLLAGTIPQDAADHRKWWYKKGVARRILPLNYTYSSEIVLRIKDEIDHDRGAEWSPGAVLRVPEVKLEIKIGERETKRIREIADHAGERLGENGVDALKQYRAMARAHAALRSWKRPTVTSADLEFLETMDKYVSWDVAVPL